MRNLSYIFLLSLTLIACNQATKNSNTISVSTSNSDSIAYSDISLVSLIANPEKYNAQRVRIIGFMHLEFEGDCIYFHKEDYINQIYKNALWLDLKTRGKQDSLMKFSNHYVIVEGVFESQNLGHMGANSGTVTNITRVQVWP